MDTYKFAGSEPWQMISLDPAGLLAFCLWIRDPLFRAGEGLLRRQLLNEGYISMRESFEHAAPSRRRRRMVEMFENGIGNAEAADVEAYWATWATVMQCQFVRIGSRESKTIAFSPPLNQWTAHKPVYYVDTGCETIFLPPEGGSVERRSLAVWTSDREADGWTVAWPVADGTKEEMERRLMPVMNQVRVSERAKKAEIAAALGRHDGLEALMRFSAGEELD